MLLPYKAGEVASPFEGGGVMSNSRLRPLRRFASLAPRGVRAGQEKRFAVIAAFALALAASVAPAGAQDVDARTMALIHDAVNGRPPAGSSPDPTALAATRKALEAEKLLTAGRVATPEPDIVDLYGRALLLGPRAREFVPELAAIRNVAMRRDREATAAAIAQLFGKAGRATPDAAQLDKFVDAVIGAGASEGPEETARRRIEKPGHTIEITDAKRAGLFTIEISTTSPDGQAARTVIVAEKIVVPNASKSGVEQHAVPMQVCTVTQAQAAARQAALNGPWSGQNGDTWDVSGAGGSISLVERRTGKPALTYTGTYRLGRIQATHPVGAANEIDTTLPDWVRAGLVGKTSFVVRLDDCDAGRLEGTWESRHVTYSPAFKTISRIHDPYDLRLVLSRGGEGVARGATDEEAP